MSLRDQMAALGEQAVTASRGLLRLNARKKNTILRAMADELESRRDAILAANSEDLVQAEQAGTTGRFLDRLRLTPTRLDETVQGLRGVADLKDPVGSQICRWIRPNGLVIVKKRVPVGVIAVVYESHPAIAVSAVACCLKTANAIILRGGSEAQRTSTAIVAALVAGGSTKGLPDDAVQLVETTDRAAVDALVCLDSHIDLVIPRGGSGLVRSVLENATVPVVAHSPGVCHTYVDESADLQMALAICENAKCQRPAVGNTMETLLVHEKIAPLFLPALASQLEQQGVELRGDEASRAIVPAMQSATQEDWSTDYLDRALAVRVLGSLADAIDHINRYGTRHSDAIVAESEAAQKAFALEVDSAAVFINSSTRFHDGACFGMGAEVGISTSKLHARGPVGLEELTTYKYVIQGNGQIRE